VSPIKSETITSFILYFHLFLSSENLFPSTRRLNGVAAPDMADLGRLGLLSFVFSGFWGFAKESHFYADFFQ
jgi:hypothetical protein